MSSRGVHFALAPADAERLLALDDPDQLVEFISEDLEERYFEAREWIVQTDNAWDAIHRCLADGRLVYASGPIPLRHAVLGGEPLDAGDDYTACFVTPAQVQELAPALARVTREWFAARYATLAETDYGPTSAEDLAYTWRWFEGLPEFFAKAAKAGRAVLFTTDA
ncbi:YfbM family protein [Nannocystaceae bacterium ST9]